MFDPFYILVAIIFLTIVTVLVAAHELGHYLFARYFKMGVEEFAIGFGRKPLWTYKQKSYAAEGPDGEPITETTNFTIRPWPLGGFVRIKGMIPEEDGSEVDVRGGFYSKPPWQRFVVLLAGPVFSILAGFALLIPLFMMVGVNKPLNEPVFGHIVEKSPAEVAGLKKGDRVLSVDGKPMATWYDLVSSIRDRNGAPVNLVVRRGEREFPVEVTPKVDTEKTPVLGPDLEATSEMRIQSKLGAGFTSKRVPQPIGSAITHAVALPGRMVASLFGVVKQPSKFKDEMGGPVSMVAITAGSAREGLPDVLFFAGALSISLGIFNLLPIAPLDGGQMVVAFAEMLRRGRRLSFKVQNAVTGVGFVLILMLIVGVFAADINRFLPGKKEETKVASEKK